MMGLLVFREQIKTFYGKYSVYIIPVCKFVFALTVFVSITLGTGYMRQANNPFIPIVAAAACAFLPSAAITFFTCILILLHLYAVSVEITAVVALLFLMMFLLYFVFKPGNAWLMTAVILAGVWEIPGTVILSVGLVAGPLSVVPVCFGILTSGFVSLVKTDFSVFSSGSSSLNGIQKIIYYMNSIVGDEKTLLLLGAALLTVLLVWAVRRLSIHYAWAVALAVGTIVYSFLVLAGNFIFDVHVNIPAVVISIVLGVAVGAVLEFFLFAVDYSRTEYVQFEDDEYYYYVKAVPKISVTKPEVQVKNITEAAEDAQEEE